MAPLDYSSSGTMFYAVMEWLGAGWRHLAGMVGSISFPFVEYRKNSLLLPRADTIQWEGAVEGS